LTQYLEELIEKDLIKDADPEGENRIYLLTEKGREFLKEFIRMERFSEAFGIEI